MIFKVNIKPTVYTGQGISDAAIDKFYRVMPSATCFTISKYGNCYMPIKKGNSGDSDYAYCFNMQVFKRGKHRKNKHFTLYVYKIDLKLLDILGLEIIQKRRNFQIISKNK